MSALVLVLLLPAAVMAWTPPLPSPSSSLLLHRQAHRPLPQQRPLAPFLPSNTRPHSRLASLPAAAAAASSSIPFPATLAGGTGVVAGLQASPWWTWTMLLLASTVGVAAERTRLGAALSSPLITMGVALVACNVGLLPAAAPVRLSNIYLGQC